MCVSTVQNYYKTLQITVEYLVNDHYYNYYDLAAMDNYGILFSENKRNLDTKCKM